MDTRFLTEKDLFLLCSALGIVDCFDSIINAPEQQAQLSMLRGVISQLDIEDTKDFLDPLKQHRAMISSLISKLEEVSKS